MRSRELLGQMQVLFATSFQGQRPDLSSVGLGRDSPTFGGGWNGWVRRCLQAGPQAPMAEVANLDTYPKLSEVMEEYGKRQRLDGVSLKTVADKKSVVDLFIRVIGDLSISHITREDAKTFKEVALTLPPRATQQPGKSLRTLAQEAQGTISVTTFNHYLKNLSTLFTYARQEGYCDKNPFDGLGVKQRSKASALRSRFSENDLRLIFSTSTYERRSTNKPHRYWLPLLGLFTGARLNELCQLYLDDVVNVQGVDCFHIRAQRPDQKLKNATSERLIPVHSRLKELGFMEYVKALREQGAERVFPELSLHKRHGYGAIPSRWFAGYRKRLGFTEGKERKDFHSFRHTVADHLKQSGVLEGHIAALLGHTSGGITFNRYGKDYNPGVLLPIMELLSFDAIDSGDLTL